MAHLTTTTTTTTTIAFVFTLLLAWQGPQEVAAADFKSKVTGVINGIGDTNSLCRKSFEIEMALHGTEGCDEFKKSSDVSTLFSGCPLDSETETIVEGYHNSLKDAICDSWDDEATDYVNLKKQCHTELATYQSCIVQQICCADIRLGKTKIELLCRNNEYAELEDIVCNGSTTLFISLLTILSAFVIGTWFKN